MSCNTQEMSKIVSQAKSSRPLLRKLCVNVLPLFEHYRWCCLYGRENPIIDGCRKMCSHRPPNLKTDWNSYLVLSWICSFAGKEISPTAPFTSFAQANQETQIKKKITSSFLYSFHWDARLTCIPGEDTCNLSSCTEFLNKFPSQSIWSRFTC